MRCIKLLPIIGAVKTPGRLAQRLERLVHTEEVGGSNPPSPTISRRYRAIPTAPNSGKPRWRNGRRAAFRAQCPLGRVGSNPSLGTKTNGRHQNKRRKYTAKPSSRRCTANRVSGHTYDYALVAQRIERCPAEAEAVGSNPAKRTIFVSPVPAGIPARSSR